MFTLAELDNVIPLVRAIVPPTPQYAWPLLKALTGVEIVVKHENHTPIGAFKLRGGIVYFDRLNRARPQVQGVVTATRGNHGQSLAFAGTRAGIAVTIVVPHGNSTEKNAAMRAFGAELIEHGRDFDEAKEAAIRIATERGLEYAPSFHRDFVIGVATYAHELFSAVDNLDTVYVPIGLGSGICGMIGTRDALGLKTKIVGVVAEFRERLSSVIHCRPRGGDQLRIDIRRRNGSARIRSDSPRSYSQGRGTNCPGIRRRNRRGDPEHLQYDPQLRRGRRCRGVGSTIQGAWSAARAAGSRHPNRTEHRSHMDADRAGRRNAQSLLTDYLQRQSTNNPPTTSLAIVFAFGCTRPVQKRSVNIRSVGRRVRGVATAL